MTNTYWDGYGRFRKEYGDMNWAVNSGKFKYLKSTEKIIDEYSHYYISYELPKWAKKHSDLTIETCWGWVLSESGEQALENRLDAAIAKEWARFQKANR